jgi:hypothetical protein
MSFFINGMQVKRLIRMTMSLIVVLYLPASLADPVKVSVVKTAEGYQLLRAGEPYVVKGAGFSQGDMSSLAKFGGNSIRTWHVEEDLEKGMALLDQAQALGITVSLCLNIARERHGFDYNDPEVVKKQFEQAKDAVQMYKDHPALLSWIIGNELNYDYRNPRVYDAVNDIALMIHDIDPYHPTTTTIAGWNEDLVGVIGTRAPALDFLSIQMYGDLINLPRYIKKAQFKGPYFVTEWGAVGHWEVGKTAWGAPIEATSSMKANNYRKSYEKVIASAPHQALGNYVFLWGQKQERTPTWYGMFLESGETTESIDVVARAWNGEWPANRSPGIKSVHLASRRGRDNIYLSPSKTYSAKVKAFDPDKDTLTFAWSIKPESDSVKHGGDFEQGIADLEGLFTASQTPKASFRAPSKTGAYRIYVYVYDGNGAAAHANIPFFVRAK